MSDAGDKPPSLSGLPFRSTGESAVLAAAVLVGLLTGVLATVFRWLVHVLDESVGHLREWPEPVGTVAVVAAPALGGLLVGVLVYWVLRVRAGHGVPAVIKAVAADHPLDDWKMGAKAGTSIVTIGFGGSAGPEGPIVELGAVIGSYAQRWLRLPGTAVRTLMGCGAASGVAAVFNAPIGGVLFVVEVVMRDISARMLAPMLLSAVAASAVGQWWFGDAPAFPVPPVRVSGAELRAFPVFGVVCGLVSALFVRAVSAAGEVGALSRIPEWCRPAAGGLLVGMVAVWLPAADGEGYDTIAGLLADPAVLSAAVLLLAAKMFTTASTLGSGGTGGAFAPALVLGAAAGALSAGLVSAVAPAGITPEVAGILGMGGLIAGTFQAPLSGLMIALALAGRDGQMILPLMGVTVLASWVARRLAGASMYDLSLLREGLDIQALTSLNRLLARRPVSDLPPLVPVCLRSGQTLGEMIDLVGRCDQTVFPLLDGAGGCKGVVMLDDLRTVLRDQSADLVLVADDLARPADPVLKPNDSLAAAWDAFTRTPADEIVVLSDAGSPTGLVRRRDLVRMLRVN